MSETDPFQLAAPDPRLRVSVIIPARDEAAYLLASLQSLIDQRNLHGRCLDPRTFEVIVLANNCTDETAHVAQRFADQVVSQAIIHVVSRDFPAPVAHIGTARRWLMDLACRRLELIGCSAGLIASTDADTQVAPTWIDANLDELAAGADAVAGLIQVSREELRRRDARVRRAYWLDQVHRRLKLELEALIDPNPLDHYPRHDDHGGASIAITPQMYRRVGGLPPRRTHEDVALAEALWRVDARFVHSRKVRVVTSSRTIGRATNGQSDAFLRWTTQAEDQVLDVALVESELHFRRNLRQLFTAKSGAGTTLEPRSELFQRLETVSALDGTTLEKLVIESPTFGSLLERIRSVCEPTAPSHPSSKIPISEAIRGLRRRIRSNHRNELTRPSPTGPSDTEDQGAES